VKTLFFAGGLCAFLVGAAMFCGCAAVKADTNLTPDLNADMECVAGQLLAGNTNPVLVEAACLPGQLTTVVDFMEALITSTFGIKHPEVDAKTVLANVQAERALGTAGR
jgi:Fe-S cluster assembly iron-binding protein IscA